MRQDTLVFLLNDNRKDILLAMKKRGFGAGKYNGVGGKVNEGETILDAAVREAHEEIGVTIKPSDLEKVAELIFSFDQKSEWSIHCHVYLTYKWKGLPIESEEMAPKWFTLDSIPFQNMWIDDQYWLPLVVSGQKLNAAFHFSSDGSMILEKNMSVLLE